MSIAVAVAAADDLTPLAIIYEAHPRQALRADIGLPPI